MSENTPEEWRPVVGYEGLYEVSSHGRVKQLSRVRKHHTGANSVYPERVKKATKNSTGHHLTYLTKNGSRRGKLVHRLVLEAFKGSPPSSGSLGLHGDDNPDNNHISNLRWGSARENQEDAIRNNRNPKVSQTHCLRGHEFTEENTYNPEGTRNRYCRKCRESWRERALTPPTHGALSTYTNHRCRCGECLEAHRTYKRTGEVVTIKDIKERVND